LNSLVDQLGGLCLTLEDISFNIRGRIDMSRYDFECYWPIAIENALEPYHIPLVHSETLATLGLEEGLNVFEGCNSVWHAPVGNERVRKQLTSLKKLFNIDFQQEEYMSIFLFPFSMISSTFGYSYSLQNFFPAKSAERTYFTSRLYAVNAASDRASGIVEPFIQSTVAVNRRVFDEDHEVCRHIPSGSWSSAPLPYASKAEAKLVHFRDQCRRYQQIISEEGPSSAHS
jgi:phenylpropionate dioxygenase-like ring-hydroxylating dioxygenase large terminal subunit